MRMQKHPVRKFFGLSVLYSAVIIGIFLLQFKTESIISKSLGKLEVSLSQTEDENHVISLKNQFRAVAGTMTFFADDKNPVVAYKSDGTSIPLVLESFEEQESNSIALVFADKTTLTFRDTENSEGEHVFSAMANPSEGFDSISVPFKLVSSAKMEKISQSNCHISQRDSIFEFTAHEILDSQIILSKTDSLARYNPYNPVLKFTFSQLAETEHSTQISYETKIQDIKKIFVQEVRQILNSGKSDSLTESDITAWVAEMGENQKYNLAIDSIPASFKKGNKRTYFSAPYFNNLVSMNKSLIVQNERYSALVASGTLEVFTAEGIEDYILREKYSTNVKKLLALPATLGGSFEPTPLEAAGIIRVYVRAAKHDTTITSQLDPFIPKCISVIEDSCTNGDDSLIITSAENQSYSVYQTVQIGTSLIMLGKLKNDQSYQTAGYLLMNTCLNKEPLDIHTVASIYPLIAPDNTYYPHAIIFGYYGTKPVWAWTCARSISYKVNSSAIANIEIDFPQGISHYIIFNGIPDFNGKIEIQGLMFRTDPRFETYNSSGYVYQSQNSSLLIKSRHKSRIELIRLFYSQQLKFSE